MRSFKRYNLQSFSTKPIIFFLLVLLIISNLPIGMSQPYLASYVNITYDSGSEFEINLNKVLDDLVQNTSQTGFNTSSYGQSPNSVYGRLQCRGDTLKQECYNCSQVARQSFREINTEFVNCGHAIGCHLWLDLCNLRYANDSFFSQLDYSEMSYSIGFRNSKYPDVYQRAARSLLSNLSAEASHPANKGFAAGTTIDSAGEKISGLVECSRDLSMVNCTQCLSKAIGGLLHEDICVEGTAWFGSCFVRYDNVSFTNWASPGTPSNIKSAIVLAIIASVFMAFIGPMATY